MRKRGHPGLLGAIWLAMIFFSATSVALGGETSSPTPDFAFYKGKTLTLIVPYKPGGHFDRMARLVAHYMGPALQAEQIHVVNRPGGASIVGTNAVYNAEPDGLTFGITPGAGAIINQIAETAGVEYKVQKFGWIGEPGEDPEVLWTHTEGSLKSFADLMHRQDPIVNLASGKGGIEYVAAELLYSIFNIPHRMVATYDSHGMLLTFFSGNGDAFVLSASSTLAHAEGKATPLAVLLDHRSKYVPDVPTVIEQAHRYDLSEADINALHVLINTLSVHRAFFAPPGVPDGRLMALRKTMKDVVEKPAFQSDAKKERLFLGYSSPETLRKKSASAFAHQEVLRRYLGSGG